MKVGIIIYHCYRRISSRLPVELMRKGRTFYCLVNSPQPRFSQLLKYAICALIYTLSISGSRKKGLGWLTLKDSIQRIGFIYTVQVEWIIIEGSMQ